MIALFVAIGFGLANFGYQGLTGQDWSLAMERTWFQAWACIAVGGAEYVVRRISGTA